ncbi:MAG: aminoacyl-tRNA hydrolase [Planctomycetota bacterium]
MKYIAGLGNPGRRYRRTRHNLGWMVLHEMADELEAGDEEERWGGIRLRVGKITLFKPLTFMNRSGEAIGRLIASTRAPTEDLLVVMDDLNLEFGTVRLRAGGSAGGHRGLKSVIDRLGTDDIPRLRLGIGPCPREISGKNYVLGEFTEEEMPVVDRMVERGARAAMCWAEEGVDMAMSRYNGTVDGM